MTEMEIACLGKMQQPLSFSYTQNELIMAIGKSLLPPICDLSYTTCLLITNVI